MTEVLNNNYVQSSALFWHFIYAGIYNNSEEILLRSA